MLWTGSDDAGNGGGTVMASRLNRPLILAAGFQSGMLGVQTMSVGRSAPDNASFFRSLEETGPVLSLPFRA